ncbi:HTH domain-containing protein [Fusibacter ferrireducens]|uniref:HTH domain-containing protein n=1 Tax=Fusibacter ferrireducens TaxID=2785058 RepID=A0ABR9ZQW3_9FIRM|nr:HTH domain-containing protein [Fusibacter ferrireducens]MBF4692538.1 HTH domain-containing protein [Fusibacter ferrireducens]
MLKIGIIGPQDSLVLMDQYLQNFFEDVKTFKIEFSIFEQIPNIIQYLHVQESNLDAVIFSSKVSYDIVNHAMHSKNPWVYVDRNHIQLQRLLLKIAVQKKYDPLHISVDCFNEKSIINAYSEIGLQKNEYQFYEIKPDIFNPHFANEINHFHLYNYYKKKVSVCITEFPSIYADLKSKGIPCMLSETTFEDVHQAVQKLELKIRSRINESSQIVVLAIEIDQTNEYSIITENDYQMMTEKIKVTEKIYLFAQRIQATVIEIGKRGYLLFSTKNILENETEKLQHMALLDDVSSSTSSTISVGIGYGITAREANYNANLGMLKAQKSGGNHCYAVNEGVYIGPILNTIPSKEKRTLKIDDKFLKVSESTGISIDTIFRIQCYIDQQKDIFTPKELATYLEISKRSVDRILDKLEYSGYMTVVGKKSETGTGRPSRIIKISFDYKLDR